MAMACRTAARGDWCALSTAASEVLGFRGSTALWHDGQRFMAIQVDVKDNNVHQALSELNRKRDEEGLSEEMRKRQYYLNGSDMRYEKYKRSYKHAVGRIVTEQIKWVMRLRPGK
ncbi:hypothetical protein PLESTM_001884200 [Pleodorina starrii]|nr:hypothetical protein PLESTM_001884200 [Pleodorina starrii]